MLLLKRLSCRRAAPLLARWCEDPARLSPAEHARVDRHLAGCPACRGQVEAMRRMADLLRRERPGAARPAPDLWARLQARIAEEPQDAPPLLPQLSVVPDPVPAGGAGWARVLARAVPVGVAATLGLFVLTFRADFALLGGSHADRAASVAPAAAPLLPPSGLVAGEDADAPAVVGAPARSAGAAAPSPRPRRPEAVRRSSAVVLLTAREQARLAAEAMQRENGGRGASGLGVGRSNPFEPLRRPESAPVLAAAGGAGAAASKPGPSAPAPAPLRGRPHAPAITVAAAAPSPTRSVTPAGAASLDPPAARPPQMVAMAAGHAGSRPAAQEAGDVPEPSRSDAGAAGDVEQAPTVEGVGATAARSRGASAASPAASPEAALTAAAGRADGEPGAPSAVEAVSASRRQRSLFHYGGGASERQR